MEPTKIRAIRDTHNREAIMSELYDLIDVGVAYLELCVAHAQLPPGSCTL